MNLLRKSAFTLVELIIVIAIITLLAAILIVTIRPEAIFINARNAQRNNDLLTLKGAMERYFAESPILGTSRTFNDFNGYSAMLSNAQSTPPTSVCPNAQNLSLVSNPFSLNGGNGANTLSVDPLLNNGYLPKTPKDPSSSNAYKACLDTCNNNQVVIYSDISEGTTTTPNIPLGTLGTTSPINYPCSVQTTKSSTSVSSVDSYNVTLPNSVTAGDLIIVSFSQWNGGGNGISSITDNKGNGNYSLALQRDNLWFTGIYYIKAVNGGSNFTITVNPSVVNGGSWFNVTVNEYKGLTGVLDKTVYAQTGNGSGQSAGTLSTGLTSTTTKATELLFSQFMAFSGNSNPVNGVFTPGVNYTQKQAIGTGSGSTVLMTEEKYVFSTGTYDASATISTNDAGWTGLLATFK